MLVLASKSPRRAEILQGAGIPFVVRPADVPEYPLPGETPRALVERLACEKAQAVPVGEDEIVLGADTVVVVDSHILGKPVDHEDAMRMLRLLSGRSHEVITGICLHTAQQDIVDSSVTKVFFSVLSDQEIAEYVASGEPMDKAGAYGVQGRASKFAERIDGCYFNVVGLPVSLVYRYWKELSC
jgi:septum formation protein